jgi:hypothetical protein
VLFRVVLVALSALALPFGCASKKAACDEAACATGQRCVEDACRPSCTTSTDCSTGQSCALWGFADHTQGLYCVVLPSSDAGRSSSDAGTDAATNLVPVGAKCQANTDCPTAQGEFCVSGTCRLACSSHFDCQGAGECTNGTDTDGNAGHYCDLSLPQKPGQFYTSCPSGTGSECDAANDFFCIGAGPDDLAAYCTTDCTDDSSCATGFACAPLTRNPCEPNCNLTGNNQDPMCVPTDQIGAGEPYQCGAHGVTRNVCRPNRFCTSCTADADCLAVPNQVCAADESGAKICTQLCDPVHPSCPWGSAAKCGIWDQALGASTCEHRFGKCVGTGKSCEPCEKDADCGSNGACTESSFTGEHWCVDLSLSCSCNGNTDENGLCEGGGCPLSPSGLQIECDDDPAVTGSSTGICNGANVTAAVLGASPQQGCWPATSSRL